MTSIVTDFLPIKIKSKPYYIYAKQGYLQHKLLIAIYSKMKINIINQIPYTLKENNHISIQKIFKKNWEDFKSYCASINKPIRQSIITNVENMIDYRNFKKGYLFYECPKCGKPKLVSMDIWKKKNKYKKLYSQLYYGLVIKTISRFFRYDVAKIT